MKLYTKTGDKGQTSLIGGRVRKDDCRVEAYGTIDELNSFVGQAAAEAAKHEELAELSSLLVDIQQELFDCGSDLAYAAPGAPLKVGGEAAQRLEGWIDQYSEEAPEITRFILPGGSSVSALLHVCRTVCRRAERRVVTLAAEAGELGGAKAGESLADELGGAKAGERLADELGGAKVGESLSGELGGARQSESGACELGEGQQEQVAAVNPDVLTYLNRLSDFFFAAARVANARLGVPDTEYVRSAEVFRRKPRA